MTAIAIDGPAGAGKTTVARAVAKGLGYEYLDTGALYRAIAWAALNEGIAPHDEETLGALARNLEVGLDDTRVLVEGRDVSREIRAPEVTRVVSAVAAHEDVRRALLDRQRQMADHFDVVMEGRDIGSTVLPDADLKIFLTAALEERARRRCLQLGAPDDPKTRARMMEEIARRDEDDAARATSPLVRPPDAIVLDTTDLSFDEVVERVAELVRERT